MMNRTELNMKEMETVVGGLTEGKMYTVTGTKHFLALRNDYCYKDSNIIRKLHNGDRVRVVGSRITNGYVSVEDPTDGRVGYVNAEYLK